jgi:hypothetical protein
MTAATLPNGFTDLLSKRFGVKGSLTGQRTFTLCMQHMFLTATWKVHAVGQKGIGGHQLPALRNKIPMAIGKTNLTSTNHSKTGVVFLNQTLHERKSPSLATL